MGKIPAQIWFWFLLWISGEEDKKRWKEREREGEREVFRRRFKPEQEKRREWRKIEKRGMGKRRNEIESSGCKCT